MATELSDMGAKHDILGRLAQVEALAQRRLSLRQAGIHLNIPETTMHRYYTTIPAFKETWDRGREFVNNQCVEVIQKAIKKGDEALAKWWLEKHSDEFKRAPASIEVNQTTQVAQVSQTNITLNALDDRAMLRAAEALLRMQGGQ